ERYVRCRSPAIEDRLPSAPDGIGRRVARCSLRPRAPSTPSPSRSCFRSCPAVGLSGGASFPVRSGALATSVRRSEKCRESVRASFPRVHSKADNGYRESTESVATYDVRQPRAIPDRLRTPVSESGGWWGRCASRTSSLPEAEAGRENPRTWADAG